MEIAGIQRIGDSREADFIEPREKQSIFDLILVIVVHRESCTCLDFYCTLVSVYRTLWVDVTSIPG